MCVQINLIECVKPIVKDEIVIRKSKYLLKYTVTKIRNNFSIEEKH